MLAGCGGQKNTDSKKEDDKIAISMYMWDRSMFKELSPWLEEKFPNINFTFVQSFNTMEYYKDLLARGEEILEKINEQLSAPSIGLTVSIGVAWSDPRGSDFKSMYARADKALYTAKKNGKSQLWVEETA